MSYYGLSYTAPQFTKEDEEREIADLTPEEKEVILDDVYGRNSEDLKMEGEIAEITAEQSDAVRNAMDRIPVEDRSGYIKASARCPNLIETETSPAIFLRHHNYDADLAAKRIAKYWNTREEVFGEERAYLPMTQSGAMGDDETLQFLRTCPQFRYFLPNDAHGRTVLFCDRSTINQENIPARLVMRKSTIEKGVVCTIYFPIINLKCFDRIRTKLMNKVSYACFPIHFRATHIITRQNSLIDLIKPAFLHLSSPIYRKRLNIHNQFGERLLHDLSDFGLVKNGLPKSICGTFEWNPTWVNEQRECEEDA